MQGFARNMLIKVNHPLQSHGGKINRGPRRERGQTLNIGVAFNSSFTSPTERILTFLRKCDSPFYLHSTESKEKDFDLKSGYVMIIAKEGRGSHERVKAKLWFGLCDGQPC